MNAIPVNDKKRPRARVPDTGRRVLMTAVLCGALVFLSTPTPADEPSATPGSQQQQPAPMPAMKEQTGTTDSQSPGKTGSMNMGSIQGGIAPAALRDPNAHSDGYEYTNMPGMEKADQIVFGKLLFDQLEFTHNGNRTGAAWDTYFWYGGDKQKLLLRSEGDVIEGVADQTTSAEALWWRPLKPFWATVLGMRQDFGPGSRTHLAFGVQGLAPYWFDLEATGYVDYDGTFSARLKGSYDLRLTNRLILTPEVESNLYSQANLRRALGAGMANIELQARLRYEVSRKFAPYIGFDWDRALGDTAKLNRPGGESVSDARFVAGVRMWR
jgi:copper resistance protein B